MIERDWLLDFLNIISTFWMIEKYKISYQLCLQRFEDTVIKMSWPGNTDNSNIKSDLRSSLKLFIKTLEVFYLEVLNKFKIYIFCNTLRFHFSYNKKKVMSFFTKLHVDIPRSPPVYEHASEIISLYAWPEKG